MLEVGRTVPENCEYEEEGEEEGKEEAENACGCDGGLP